MIYIKPEELIRSEVFYEEPIAKLNKKLESLKGNRIILTGPTGSGKTILLRYNEMQTNLLSKDKYAIYIQFDETGLFSDEKYFWRGLNEEHISQYYKLILIKKILSALNNPLLQNEMNIADNNLNEFMQFKIDKPYDESLEYDLSTGIKLKELKDKIQELTKKSLVLILDNFDQIDCGSRIAQVSIAPHLEKIADQLVLCAPKSYLGNRNLSQYDILNVDFAKEEFELRKLVKNYTTLYNATRNHFASPRVNIHRLIGYNVYRHLAEKCAGDLSFFFTVVTQFYQKCDFDKWRYDNKFDTYMLDSLEECTKRRALAKKRIGTFEL